MEIYRKNVIQQINPSTVIWREKFQVVEILKQLSILNFNHTFIYEGGGMDLIDIKLFEEKIGWGRVGCH